jgi:succinate dehydrogenase/fumarate reductase cytochrome b subunit
VVFSLLVIWHIVVRKSIIGFEAVNFFQNYISPFLFVTIYAMLAIAILSTRKAIYHFIVETKKRYPNTKYEKRKEAPYLSEYATPIERAQHYNKGMLFEIYAMMFLLLISGRTSFGIIFASTYAIYYFIVNFRRIFNTDCSKKKKPILYCIDTLVVLAMLFLSLFSSEGSVFTAIFNLVDRENTSFYMNFILFFFALLLTIPSIIIRGILKRHFVASKSDGLKNAEEQTNAEN